MDNQLEQVLRKVKLLCEQYPEFKEKLSGLFPQQADNAFVVSDGRIDDIYEYCIAKVVRSQAEDLYSDFPVDSIREQLIEDYCRMEQFRRQDNFGDFSLAVYQQIEAISNKLCCDKILSEVAEKMWQCPAYVMDRTGAVSNRNPESKYKVASLLFPGNDKNSHLPQATIKSRQSIQTLYANDKMRVIAYFIGYRTKLTSSDYFAFVDITDLLYKIYSCRNMNHRGNLQTENEERILNTILADKTINYFKFEAALAQYVSWVKKGFPIAEDLISYAKSVNK